ncbi:MULTISPECIES: TetR/AcrR family transcriptional regulator [Ensifer]|jgi:AcrR family transcriptional regulator|uniref:TetR/AcrR family transcriptional regulator n=1 Tax=Ensifer adhaerens TaxID=106592 RepID=A0A9Q9DD69_ENSAD|nr:MULTISPECIES: TetR/AcrR family transcriptional regulator [Ensifer]MBD9570956.1 TetR/AcrR family transcriptional regulator [Ensifer sp. ENS08]MBW0369406.1 TetR/AcrR family transcriptional regulator [Ensifer adhaerens]RAS09899.1 TetR family transcriptional regulator [Ensifer adhaerens]UCM22532.1 TetR/AcrR family transcriptional regulator [Ensifer adhaerens]USJ26722.1 TetR/AcrR family transcriptional regulator [Ensifer adhaerens]
MIEKQKPRRSRGRPQVRPDDETRQVIVLAAERQFCDFGYEAANINVIAQNAGVSTKTLYRLFPTKADLFERVISLRIAEFVLEADEENLEDLGVRGGLVHLLAAYGHLVLSHDTIAIIRLVLAEAERFPEVAATFWEQAIQRTSATLERWLRTQVAHGRLAVADPRLTAGMLRGMMAMEPQRAVMMGCLGTIDEATITARAESCADIFLTGALPR